MSYGLRHPQLNTIHGVAQREKRLFPPSRGWKPEASFWEGTPHLQMRQREGGGGGRGRVGKGERGREEERQGGREEEGEGRERDIDLAL